MLSSTKDKLIIAVTITISIIFSLCILFFNISPSIPAFIKNIYLNNLNGKSDISTSSDLSEDEITKLEKRLDIIENYLKLAELRIVGPDSPLDEHYTANLKALTSKYSNYPERERLVDERCYDAFSDMLESARSLNIDIYVYVSYRSYNSQKTLFDNKVNTLIKNGMSSDEAQIETKKTIAHPSTSEHQYGFSADIGDGKSYDYDSFRKSLTYSWLCDNAHLFGFILRYPEEKTQITGMRAEPWHFRYVGTLHAQYIYENDITLEEYIEKLKNEASEIEEKLNNK